MLDRGKNIDTVFKDGLSSHEVAPDAYVWESIEKAMLKQKRQSAMLIMWRSVAAACIVALIIVSVTLLHSVSDPLIVKTTSIAEEDVKPTSETKIVKTQIGISTNSNVVSKVDDKEFADLNKEAQSPILPSTEYQLHNTDRIQYTEKYLAAITDVDILTPSIIDTELHSHKEKVYYSLYNPLPGSVNKKKTSISISGVVSPSYNSKTSYGGTSPVRASSGVDVNESGINSLGGGIQVRVNTGSRWSFETGVLYAQVGQEVNNKYSYQSYNQAFLRSPSSNNVELANSLGEIVVEKTSAAQAAPQFDNMVEASYSTLVSVDAIKQTLDYIEIPMMARYSLFKSFPYLSVAGGFSSNFLVDNSAYALDDDSEKKIGETDDIKSFVLSSSIGVGIDVPIFKSIHLNFEPRLKYFLNSVSSNEDYNFQPYSFGVYGGLTFVIK